MLSEIAQYLAQSRHKISELFHDLKPTLKLKFSICLGKNIDNLFSPKAQNPIIP